MRAQPVNLIGGFYKDEALPWSAQDTVNWIPEFAEQPGTLSRVRLRGAPGLKLFATLDGYGPIRGARNVEGRLFVLAGTKLLEIAGNGTPTERGTVPGVGRVEMSHNQIPNGNQLIVVNGQAGYVWNTVTATFAKITDSGYPGAGTVAFVDQFLVQSDPFGRFWFHSDLQNALEYNTLDRYTSEASPDPIVAVAVNQFEVVVLNQTTTEFFGNRGTAQRTFASKRIVANVGCAGRHTVANLADTLFMLGHDGCAYQQEGYGWKPISTGPIQQAMAGKNWAQAFATIYETAGHKVYYLTFPDGETWGFDVVTQLWHRRASFGLKRWRVNTLTKWNGKWIAGDFQTGKLYEVDWNTFEEDGQALIAERVTGPLTDNQSAFTVDYAEIIVNAGTAGLGIDHVLELTYSDDGGRTWKNWKRKTLGRTGQYQQRVRFDRMGISRNRTWRFRISSRGRRDVLGAVVRPVGTDG